MAAANARSMLEWNKTSSLGPGEARGQAGLAQAMTTFGQAQRLTQTCKKSSLPGTATNNRASGTVDTATWQLRCTGKPPAGAWSSRPALSNTSARGRDEHAP